MITSHHSREFLLRQFLSTLPIRYLDRPSTNIHIATAPRLQRIARPLIVVTHPKLVQTTTGIRRSLIQAPVHLFGLQSLMKPLQQTQLRRHPIRDAHIIKPTLFADSKRPRPKTRPIVQYQDRHLSQRTIHLLCFLASQIQRPLNLKLLVLRKSLSPSDFNGLP